MYRLFRREPIGIPHLEHTSSHRYEVKFVAHAGLRTGFERAVIATTISSITVFNSSTDDAVPAPRTYALRCACVGVDLVAIIAFFVGVDLVVTAFESAGGAAAIACIKVAVVAGLPAIDLPVATEEYVESYGGLVSTCEHYGTRDLVIANP